MVFARSGCHHRNHVITETSVDLSCCRDSAGVAFPIWQVYNCFNFLPPTWPEIRRCLDTTTSTSVSFSSVLFKRFFVVLHYSAVLPRMSSKAHGSNNIAHARRTVQQLRIEANIDRIKVQCNNKPLSMHLIFCCYLFCFFLFPF